MEDAYRMDSVNVLKPGTKVLIAVDLQLISMGLPKPPAKLMAPTGVTSLLMGSKPKTTLISMLFLSPRTYQFPSILVSENFLIQLHLTLI